MNDAVCREKHRDLHKACKKNEVRFDGDLNFPGYAYFCNSWWLGRDRPLSVSRKDLHDIGVGTKFAKQI